MSSYASLPCAPSAWSGLWCCSYCPWCLSADDVLLPPAPPAAIAMREKKLIKKM